MPYTVNGIGTGYYGKSNREEFAAVCEYCGRQTMLSNYQTRLWVCFVFVPVIPLGRKQILNQCPSCTRHSAIAAVEWERIQQAAIEESAGEMSANRNDPDAALKMHATLVAFHKRAEAGRLADLLRTQFPNRPQVQFYLGGWYEKIGRGADADACFAKALELEPENIAAKRAVAIGCIERGELNRARSLLACMEPPQPAFDPGVFFLLAKAYQKQEQHPAALEIFQMLLDSAPAVSGDRGFRKAMRVSEKALGVQDSAVPRDSFLRSKAFFWTAAACLVLGVLMLWNTRVKSRRTLHVVNGLPVPITVEIDGIAPVQVAAQGRKEMTLAEGPHKAAVTQPAGWGEPVEFVMQTGWWERFFRSPAFALDPSRSAAVLWQQTTYTANPNPNEQEPHELHVGQPFTMYADVDYFFQEFPQTLKMKGGRVTKTRVALMPLEPLQGVAFLSGSAGGGDPLAFAEVHLRARPNDRVLLMYYQSVAMRQKQLDRCREFVAGKLADRPVLADWHRLYQTVCEETGRDRGLSRQYDEFLKAEPRNSALLYLRGRLEDDREQAFAWYDRAVAADARNPYPWYARGFQLELIGDFAGAKAALGEACRLDPDDTGMRGRLDEARFALGEYAELEQEARRDLSAPANEANWEQQMRQLDAQRRLLEALVAQGNLAAAHDADAKFGEEIRRKTPNDGMNLALRSRLFLCYMEGEFEKILAEAGPLSNEKNNDTRHEARFELGRLDEIPAESSLFRTNNDQGGYLQLCLAIAWSLKGDAEKASRARSKAIEEFARAGPDERRIADLVKGAPTFAWKETERIHIDPSLKAMVLVGLAEVCPDQRGELLALADKLNFDRRFPYHLLKRATAALQK